MSGDASRQFVALTMDHEGRFAVRVDVESAAGRVSVDSEVQATYDLRPSRLMLVVYLLPFLLVGFLWTTLLVRRRRAHCAALRSRRAELAKLGEDRLLVGQDLIQLLLVRDNLVQLGLVALNARLVGEDRFLVRENLLLQARVASLGIAVCSCRVDHGRRVPMRCETVAEFFQSAP